MSKLVQDFGATGMMLTNKHKPLKIENKEPKPSKNKANWKRLLLYIYNEQHSWHFFTEKIQYNTENNPIMKELNISDRDFQGSFEFLETNGLISPNGEPNIRSPREMLLTKRGLDVCLALEKHEDEGKKSGLLVYFTGVLAILSIFNLWVLMEINSLNSLFTGVALMLLLGFFAVIVFKEFFNN